MDNCLTLTRHIDEEAAKQRLQRLGATACEPASVRLWAAGVGMPGGTPGAWLLSAHDMNRAMLLVGEQLPTCADQTGAGINIESGVPPSSAEWKRRWLWERMATPRHWRIQVLETAPTSIWLPCWLGYRGGREHRLLVISGLSGEPLPMLKPIILKGLRQAYRDEQNAASSTPEEQVG